VKRRRQSDRDAKDVEKKSVGVSPAAANLGRLGERFKLPQWSLELCPSRKRDFDAF